MRQRMSWRSHLPSVRSVVLQLLFLVVFSFQHALDLIMLSSVLAKIKLMLSMVRKSATVSTEFFELITFSIIKQVPNSSNYHVNIFFAANACRPLPKFM